MRIENYTFDKFIVTGNNEAAYHAAKHAVTGGFHQPGFLCIFGDGSGVGKTHLLRAVQKEIEASGFLRRILYVTADEFTGELVQALHQREMAGFYEKYKKADVLLMDDIHTLEGRPHVQEELFSILEELYAGGKQVVLTVDGVGGQLPDYVAKFMDRFEQGIAVKLGTPDFEGRMRILESKLTELTEGLGTTYSPDDLQAVLAYIAGKETLDMRRLTGALARCVAYAELLDQEINLDLAEHILDKEDCL